jgi:hypothetical protein
MKIKLYLFIIIIVSILVMILMQMSSNMELFVVNNPSFDYRQINRISNGNHNYSYCIGGNITCKNTPLTSNPIEISNSPDDFYEGGKTYKPYCMTNGIEDISNSVYCDGSIFSKLNQNDMPNYRLPKSNFSFPISSEYLGMTFPYNYPPVTLDISNNNKLNFLKNQTGDVVEYMDICDVYYQTEQDNCKKTLYGSINYPTIIGDSVNVIENPPDTSIIQNTIETIQSPISETITSPLTKEKIYPPTDCNAKIKCKADFGTNIGDSLCCGQLGVLENTNYICPSVKPTCSNFDCKTQFGYCQ